MIVLNIFNSSTGDDFAQLVCEFIRDVGISGYAKSCRGWIREALSVLDKAGRGVRCCITILYRYLCMV